MLSRPQLWLSLAGLRPEDHPAWAAGPKAVIAWAARAGFRGVRLDAGRPGMRARDLDRSARRDLAAMLRRHELSFAGFDLWIPPEHYTRSDTCDRALHATLGAIELAGDVSRLAAGPGRVVAIGLPRETPAELLATLAASAGHAGVQVADHTASRVAEGTPAEEPLRLGLDPAALLLSGHDPAKVASRAASSLATARLSDADHASRIEPGASEGRLDETGYLIALQTGGYERGLVLDLRGVRDPAEAAERIVQRWDAPEAGGAPWPG